MSKSLGISKKKSFLVIIGSITLIVIFLSLMQPSFSITGTGNSGNAVIIISRDIDPSTYQYVTYSQQILSAYPELVSLTGAADTDYDNYQVWCKKMGCDHGVVSAPYPAPTRARVTIDGNEAREIISNLGFHDIPNIPGQQNLKSSGHYLHLQYNANYYTIKILNVVIS